MKTSSYPINEITGVILAGGRSARMGGRDKGLIPLAGRPFIEHVIAAIAPQTGALIISANRSLERYRAYGYPVVTDGFSGFQGPLAGICAALAETATPYAAIAPCDTPRPSKDLVRRLYRTLSENRADIAVAGDGRRLHPVFCLLKTSLHGSLRDFLEGGGRKIDRWFEQAQTAVCDFSDQAETFDNLNTPEDLARAGGPA